MNEQIKETWHRGDSQLVGLCKKAQAHRGGQGPAEGRRDGGCFQAFPTADSAAKNPRGMEMFVCHWLFFKNK